MMKQMTSLYIDSLNSDGAGSYEVLWIIEKGKYKRIIFMLNFPEPFWFLKICILEQTKI